MKHLIVLLAVLALAGCTDPNNAYRVLSNSGYTNISVGGYDWLNCSKDDFYHTSFYATSPSGQSVNGVVCAGLFFKGSTIRLN